MPSTSRKLLLTFVWLVSIAGFAAGPAAALQRGVPAKNQLATLQTPAPTGKIVIKFTDRSDILVRASGLASSNGPGLNRLNGLLAKVAPGGRLARRFSRPEAILEQERVLAETRSGRPLPNLNRYAVLTLPGPADPAWLRQVVRQLAADPAVETAFLEPVAVPAALGFDAFTGQYRAPDLPAAPGAPIAPRTDSDDFTGLQGYLQPAPDGIGAWAVASNPGARAPDVKVVDVEGAWLFDHEDLPSPFATFGEPIDSSSWRNHGTAVLGEIRGTDNSFGVRGIVPDCSVGASSIGTQSPAEAINSAAAALDPGDIILIELHAPGPNADGSGQFGYIAMEFWQDNFDAMLLASAAGLIVVEAAGNGEQNLDDPVYQNLFDRSFRDSGAIICGATDAGSLDPAWFTNHGSRVDLCGWGFLVTTCGYGNLQGDPEFPEEQWYTNSFSGTSSASPIVVGAVASLQGMVQAAFGLDLDHSLARTILVQTGTPTHGPELIGPRPNLVAAWNLASGGIGEVAGTVTEAGSGAAVADARILVVETGGFDLTGADGSYRIPMLTGNFTLEFSSFFHQGETVPATVSGGATTVVDAQLTPLPVVTLQGRVFDTINQPIADVRVSPLAVPLAVTATDPTGYFQIPGVPVDRQYRLFFDGIPGAGAAYKLVDTTEVPGPPDAWIWVGLPPAAEDFEGDDGGFVANNSTWSHGTPAAGGPAGSGFSGTECWGVGMAADYEDDMSGVLTSPIYDFSGAASLFLSFHYFSSTESGFDGVNLEVWNGDDWQVSGPLEDYTDITLGGLGYHGGWSGDSGGWRGTVFAMTEFAAADFQFRLNFGSDSGITGAGFWIDDIAFDTGELLTAVESASAPVPLPAAVVAAFPNPFNPQVTIAWQVAQIGQVDLDVFDLRGRRLRELFRGRVTGNQGRVTWDGRDDSGQLVATGTYLVQLRLADGTTASRRVLLLK